jgi:hypothetical protein
MDTIIEAQRFCDGILFDQNPLPPWINITTLESVMKADIGDYIIKGIKGEFYPCKPDIFNQSYKELKGE